MKKLTHSDRLTLVRLVLDIMPEDSIDKAVSRKYMENCSDLDIRIELQITKKSLTESRKRIKQLLLDGEKNYGR